MEEMSMSDLNEFIRGYCERKEKRERKRRICAFAMALAAIGTAIAAVVFFTAAAQRDWTEKQRVVHVIADTARGIGLAEDNPIIVECGRIWWEEKALLDSTQGSHASDTSKLSSAKLQPETEAVIKENDEKLKLAYTDTDLNILAKVIWKEAGDCPWEHQCAVGCVVLNRVRDERFPSTVYDVVAQKGQYNTSYLSGFDGIPEGCYDAARAVLSGEYTIPENVVWQAQFVQGDGVWWASYVDTGWWRSTTYFCW